MFKYLSVNMNKNIAKELVKTREAVKRKYQSLRSDIEESQIRQEKELKPITEPLQELLRTVKSEPIIKREAPSPESFITPTKKQRQSNIYQKYLPYELPSFLNDDEVFEFSTNKTPETSANESNIDQSTQEIREDILNLTKTAGYNEYLDSFHPLVRSFVDSSITGSRDSDNTHGLFHNVDTEKWKIGDSNVDFVNENVKVKNITYKGTPGLYELLFFKDPKGYTNNDLKNYMDILTKTNAYRRNNDPNEQVQGTTDVKYLTIIKPYLQQKRILRLPSRISSTSSIDIRLPQKPPQRPRTTKKGTSYLLDLSNKKIDYVYYDNINEIVERLKLLVSSKIAGHTGHQNEIISIIEELKEAKIIK